MVLNEETLSSLDGLESEPGVPLIQELVRIFIESSPADVAAVEAASKSGDFKTVEKIAHAMKSSSGSMGLEDLSAIFAGMELAAHKSDAIALTPLAGRVGAAQQLASKALSDFIKKNQ